MKGVMKRAAALIIAIIALVLGVASLTATPCSVTGSSCSKLVVGPPPPLVFVINVTSAVDPATLQASDLTVNGTPADNVILINGNVTIEFIFNSSPVVPGVNTMHIPAGAFDCGGGPVLEFTCVFHYVTPSVHN
jgi:hypothetical protein